MKKLVSAPVGSLLRKNWHPQLHSYSILSRTTMMSEMTNVIAAMILPSCSALTVRCFSAVDAIAKSTTGRVSLNTRDNRMWRDDLPKMQHNAPRRNKIGAKSIVSPTRQSVNAECSYAGLAAKAIKISAAKVRKPGRLRSTKKNISHKSCSRSSK